MTVAIDFSKIPKAIESSKECSVCFLEENALILPCGHTTYVFLATPNYQKRPVPCVVTRSTNL